MTASTVAGTIASSAIAVFFWILAIAFAALLFTSVLASARATILVSWWVDWSMGNGIRQNMNTGQMLGRMIWNGMRKLGLWQLMVAVPLWRISELACGVPARRPFSRIVMVLGLIALLNPVGMARGDALPFLFNLDAVTWVPALVTIGRCLDAQFFGVPITRGGGR
ncbi:hypothetical protein [Propionibacterium sp.]|uniref:hypothetical protein n=1 Tax=Propionibacterium sp. TaxID=1977903 RepID=UPI0039ECACED